MPKWKAVYKDTVAHRAKMVCDLLQKQNFDSVLLNKKDSSYGFGYYEVMVLSEKVNLASAFIKKEIQFE